MLKLSLVSKLIFRYSMSHQNQPNLKSTLNHLHQPQSKRSALNQDLTHPHPLQTQRPLPRPRDPCQASPEASTRAPSGHLRPWLADLFSAPCREVSSY